MAIVGIRPCWVTRVIFGASLRCRLLRRERPWSGHLETSPTCHTRTANRGGGEEQQDEGKEEAAALPHPRILSRKDPTRHQPAPKVGVTCVAQSGHLVLCA